MAWFWHFVQYNYAPAGQPWYAGATWPNVFVGPTIIVVGWLWSRTRFWPLRPLNHAVAHLKHVVTMTEELHYLAHTGEYHPRVKARVAAGEPHTPEAPHAHRR